MTLLDLLTSDGIITKKVSTTHGDEYAGPCLGCGGTDRFRVWPNHKGGRYWCRGCGKHGDAIQYLRDFRKLSYRDACQFLGAEPKERFSSDRQLRAHSPPNFTPKESAPAPDIRWQEKAQAFLGVN